MAQKAELRSEETLNRYYVMFDGTGDPEEEEMVAFWRQTVHEYVSHVQKEFGVSVDHLVRRFTLHDRVPCGLPFIMQELEMQGSLTSREQIMNGEFFEKQSSESAGGKRAFVAGVARSVASGLYKNTFGYLFGNGDAQPVETPADKEYICVDYLER